MIPASLAKQIMNRFEKAVFARACALVAGPLTPAITFEYRQAKRELVALLTLLRTGENPDRAMEMEPSKEDIVLFYKPKEPSPR